MILTLLETFQNLFNQFGEHTNAIVSPMDVGVLALIWSVNVCMCVFVCDFTGQDRLDGGWLNKLVIVVCVVMVLLVSWYNNR